MRAAAATIVAFLGLGEPDLAHDHGFLTGPIH
jgi:hypothetical protein